MADDHVALLGPARQAQLIRDVEVSPRELVTLYLERIAGWRAEPPPRYWDGVWRFTHK